MTAANWLSRPRRGARRLGSRRSSDRGAASCPTATSSPWEASIGGRTRAPARTNQCCRSSPAPTDTTGAPRRGLRRPCTPRGREPPSARGRPDVPRERQQAGSQLVVPSAAGGPTARYAGAGQQAGRRLLCRLRQPCRSRRRQAAHDGCRGGAWRIARLGGVAQRRGTDQHQDGRVVGWRLRAECPPPTAAEQ
jgi:hypothetical protein